MKFFTLKKPNILIYFFIAIIGSMYFIFPHSAFADFESTSVDEEFSEEGSACVSWANKNNILLSDNQRSSTASVTTNQKSCWLKVKKLNLNIPADATIYGIRATIERQAVGVVRDKDVKLIKNGVIQDESKPVPFNYPESDITQYYGLPTSLWSSQWTPAVVNSPGFGIALRVNLLGTTANPAKAKVDNIKIIINYRLPSLSKKVRVLYLDPYVTSQGKYAHEIGTNYDPALQVAPLINDLNADSQNTVSYTVVRTETANSYIPNTSGMLYNDTTFLNCLNDDNSPDCYPAMTLDYAFLENNYALSSGIRSGEYDEVWLWMAAPFRGCEWQGGGTTMWNICHDAPARQADTPNYMIMGFCFCRPYSGVNGGVALHSFGHRAEMFLNQAYANESGSPSPQQYYRNNITNPGNSEIGTVHIPFNGTIDYDFTNLTVQATSADDWLNNYPNLTGAKTQASCTLWGCDHGSYQNWWLSHLPNKTGTHLYPDSKKFQNNWWKYIIDFNSYPETNPNFVEGLITDPTIKSQGISTQLY